MRFIVKKLFEIAQLELEAVLFLLLLEQFSSNVSGQFVNILKTDSIIQGKCPQKDCFTGIIAAMIFFPHPMDSLTPRILPSLFGRKTVLLVLFLKFLYQRKPFLIVLPHFFIIGGNRRANKDSISIFGFPKGTFFTFCRNGFVEKFTTPIRQCSGGNAKSILLIECVGPFFPRHTLKAGNIIKGAKEAAERIGVSLNVQAENDYQNHL